MILSANCGDKITPTAQFPVANLKVSVTDANIY